MPARRLSWIASAYFYLAALTGLVFVLTGATIGLLGMAKAAFPGIYYDGPCEYCSTKDEIRDDGWEGLISGGVTTAVGAPVLVWHLRQVRRREAEAETAGTA